MKTWGEAGDQPQTSYLAVISIVAYAKVVTR
jgi:hypothetical protein